MSARIDDRADKLTRQDLILPQLGNLEEIKIYNSDVKKEVIRQNPQETADTVTNNNQDLADTSTTTPQSTGIDFHTKIYLYK